MSSVDFPYPLGAINMTAVLSVFRNALNALSENILKTFFPDSYAVFSLSDKRLRSVTNFACFFNESQVFNIKSFDSS